MAPFFAVIMAMIFLKESPKLSIFFGILLIVSGVTSLMKRDKNDSFLWKPVYFFYPLGTAVLAGLAANLRKYGLI